MGEKIPVNITFGIKDPKPITVVKDGNNLKYIIRVFKGQSVADPERVMLRLKVKVVGDLKDYIPIDLESIKEIVEQIDLEFDLLELFLCQLFDARRKVIQILATIRDLYDVSKVGALLGEIELDHSGWLKLLEFLQIACYKPLETEHVF